MKSTEYYQANMWRSPEEKPKKKSPQKKIDQILRRALIRSGKVIDKGRLK